MRILTTIAVAAAALVPTVATAATVAGEAAGATRASGASAAAHQAAVPAVQPNPAAPGSPIWVTPSGCTSATGTATSPALSAPITLSTTGLSGPGTLRDDLMSGSYPLTLHCGSTLTATIHVVAAARGAGPAAPNGAADTGDGSASDHLGIGDAALGSAFVLGGIAFGTVSLVRRRRAAARE